MPFLIINGTTETFSDAEFPPTGAHLLQRLALESRHTVAEVDGEVVARSQFGEYRLRDGQVIELVRFVGGG